MLLVLDVGNTNAVMGIYRGETLLGSWRLTSQKRTSDEIGFMLLGLLREANVARDALSGCIYASVVPSLDGFYMEAVKKYLNLSCMRVTKDLDLGIVIDVENPSEVGADRLLNAVAAKEKYGTPLIVVDLGTAITLDVVSKEGAYLGGAIAPGMEVGMELLFLKTAKLPQIDLKAPQHYIGRSTREAIQSGIIYGFVGMIDTIARGIFKELGGKCCVVATGGHAKILAEHSEIVTDLDPELTLEGLRIVYKRNSVAE